MAARHGLVPWHIYRALPVSDRAEIVAFWREDSIREGHRAQRLKEKSEPRSHANARDAWLDDAFL